MEIAFPVAQNGIQSALASQVVISQNLANLTTPGYKTLKAYSGNFRIPGTAVVETAMVTEPGPVKQTQRPLDLTIAGRGFFVIQANGRRAFTRAGNFHVDEDGNLVTPAGFPLENQIQIPVEATDVTVTQSGLVIASYADGSNEVLGQLEIAKFPNPAGLIPIGDNAYVEGPDSGDANLVTPGEEGAGVIYQGFLEQSNVDEATEITNQILNQRYFQLNLKTFQVMNDMVGRTVDLTT